MSTGQIQVHLIDGTYELFRQFYGRPDPGTFGAAASVLRSTLSLLGGGATHVAVATDHVIESFRNELWPGYKTSAGVDRAILDQIPALEDALAAMGVTVWPMVEHEADDALASAAKVAAADPRVKRVLLCTPDKDLGQCVGGKVIQWDRALLFRRIATCIDDLKVGTVDDWAWRGPTPRFDEVITQLGATRVRQDLERIVRR